MNTIKAMLSVQNLCKSFEQTKILDDISFSVSQGEMIAIMGPSGSGKSTLLYNISGMDQPDCGSVKLNQSELCQKDEAALSKIRLHQMGFIFQHSYLLKNLSIYDNIVLPGFKAGKFTREQVNARANELMKKTKITEIADHDIKKVSGGQLQRASICRALINQPDLLFGDEPTGALNSSATKEVMDIMNQINAEGTTVILVTHDARVAARADRIVFLMDGKIHDELTLGKFKKDASLIERREKKLGEWLEKQGF